MNDAFGMDQQSAQRRADQIHAFQDELALLEQEDVLQLTETDRARIQAFHADLLHSMAGQFDVDTSHSEKGLSWGMRIASFIGALAMSAAVFFFFYQFWGYLGTTAQVAILVAAPILTTVAVEWVWRRERPRRYFTSLTALVAFGCFVLDLSMLGQIFNIAPGESAFLAWAAFGLILAYTYDLKLLLVAGLTSLMGYLAAVVGVWGGLYWLSFGDRPEHFLLSGLALFVAGWVIPRQRASFAAIYRVYGLLVAFIAVLILANSGESSYLPWSNSLIENLYQLLGFVGSGLTIWLGIRRRWSGLTNLGSTFLVLFLYTKLFNWWWDWMPKYLFFLLMGLIAIGLLFLLQRLRLQMRRVKA